MKIENRAEFSQRVINDLKSRSTIGMLFYFLLGFIVVMADDFYKRHTDFTLLFGILISSICFFRLVHQRVSKWMKKSHRSLNNAIFFISVGISGSIWGICFARFMVLEGEHTAKLLIAICTAGLSAGAIVAFIPSLRLAIFYNFVILVPAIALMSFHRTNLPLAVSMLMYSFYLVLMARRGNREYWQALKNEQLLIKKSEQLHLLSRIDSLTGLYNRRHFDQRLDQETKKASRVQRPPTVIIGDIDYFKKINDQHGHQAGDEFLKLTASLLMTVFKRTTDIVARFGGEEFIVLLTDSTPHTALGLAEDLRRRMSDMLMPYKGISVSTTMSIGVANCAHGINESRDALIARADKALYRAKKEGRNRTIVAPQVHSSPQ